jgi:hypothetical protein
MPAALPNHPPDDAPSNRGLIRTLAVVASVALLVALATFALDHLPSPTTKTNPAPTPPSPQSLNAIPTTPFTQITTPAGISFSHSNGAYGDKLLPETMGGGVAAFDYNNDGLQDLLFINGNLWPWQTNPPTTTPTHHLYLNNGQGHFTDTTPNSGLNFSCYGMGVATGDYNNDGFTDVFITATSTNYLLKNLGNGRFLDVTADAGVGGNPEDWSTSAAWFDMDNDGDLDLFVCNYLRWSREIDYAADYQLPGIGRAYGQPWNFPSTFPCLYRNNGNGTFTDCSASSGIQLRNRTTNLPLAKSLGVRPVDVDSDGWLDLIVANDTVQNFVFRNQKDGTFRDIGPTSGIAFDAFGGTRGAMGIDAAHFNQDNSLGISIGNFANEMTAIYVAKNQTTLFTDEALSQGIGTASQMSLTFGIFFFDYDLDGWLDLLTANGHIESDIEKIAPNQHYAQPAQLFWNAHGTSPHSGFLAVPSTKTGTDLFTPIVGRGSAYADFDLDGDLDVVLTQINGPPLLLRNDQNLHHNWIRLKLIGTADNTDAIGTRVQVRIGKTTLSRQVMPTRGYLSQSELPLTIGLGTATKVDELLITWPNGHQQPVPSPNLNALTTIRQTR